jgi:hypothetical protein
MYVNEACQRNWQKSHWEEQSTPLLLLTLGEREREREREREKNWKRKKIYSELVRSRKIWVKCSSSDSNSSLRDTCRWVCDRKKRILDDLFGSRENWDFLWISVNMLWFLTAWCFFLGKILCWFWLCCGFFVASNDWCDLGLDLIDFVCWICKFCGAIYMFNFALKCSW